MTKGEQREFNFQGEGAVEMTSDKTDPLGQHPPEADLLPLAANNRRKRLGGNVDCGGDTRGGTPLKRFA
jgi:hypothetical protein